MIPLTKKEKKLGKKGNYKILEEKNQKNRDKKKVIRGECS